MTLEQLEDTARDILRRLKHELRNTEEVKPLFRAYYRDGSHKDFNMPLGTEHLLNSGDGKELMFGYLREYTKRNPVTLWVFATDSWMGQATEEGNKHIDEFSKYTDQGFVTLQEMGWVVVEEAITLTAQTERDVVIMRQIYTRKPRLEWLGVLDIKRLPAKQFGGRQKMWGATHEDITGYVKEALEPEETK